MRTDVKIGFIFAFVVVLGLVAYFAWAPKKPDGSSQVPPKASADLTTGNDTAGGAGTAVAVGGPTLDSGLQIRPAGMATSAPSTMPATTSLGGGLTSTMTVTSAPGSSIPSGFATAPPTLSTTRPGEFAGEPRSGWDVTPTTRPSAIDRLDTGGFSWGSPTTTPSGGGLSTGAADFGGTNPTTYAIAKGDTFGTLAKKFHTTVKAIEIANPGVNSSKLKIKQVINIPSASAAAGTGALTAGTATTTPAHGRAATTRPARRGTSRAATTSRATAATGPEGEPGGTYTVKAGDTLRGIAKRIYGDENYYERIARVNRSKLPNPDVLKVNMVLQLPPK